MADDIDTVIKSMGELTSSTIKAGIEFQGFTKKITQVAAGTEGASKSWTTFSRLVSGTPLWAFQNKLRAYLSILAGFETRSKANSAAAIKEQKDMIDAIKGYKSMSEEFQVLTNAMDKTANATYVLRDSMASLRGIKDKDFIGEKTAQNLENKLLESTEKRRNAIRKMAAIRRKVNADRARGITTISKTTKADMKQAKLEKYNAGQKRRSIQKTVAMLENLDKVQVDAIKNTIQYQQTLLATGDENLAIRRGIRVLHAKKKILDKEQKMRIHDAKLAYAQDEERVKIAISNAEKLAKAQNAGKFKTSRLKKQAERETRKRMKGEMNELAGVELQNTLESFKDNMIGSVKNMIPLLAPIGALLKVSKLSLSALNLRSMTADKFQIFVLKFVKGLQPIMKMMMMYLIYAILFIVAAAVIFKYLKEFYDILKRFGVIEEIKQLGRDAFKVIKTFYKAISSFLGGDYEKGLDYVITGAKQLGSVLLKAGKLALQIGFLAIVAAFGVAMKFIKAVAESPELQKKLLEILMYVGMAVAGFLVLQFLIGLALTALSFLALPALIITGILAALFAVAYYFGDELETFKDYFMAVLEPIGKFLFGIGSFVLGIPDLIKLLVEGAIKKVSEIFKFDFPKLDIPFMANGGISKGGMTVVGERGPELVNLSKGSRVFSNSESRKMVSSSGTVNNFNITINAKDTSKAEMRRIANELGNMINNKMNRTGATRTMR